MKEKVTASIEFIRKHWTDKSAALLSFGKDSMVLAHLIREASPHNPMRAHGFPVPVIYLRDPWFPYKNTFADETAISWGMEVHNWLPSFAGVKVKSDMLELVSRYPLLGRDMDVPKNVCSPEDYPRRDFICGLNDWVKRPKGDQTYSNFDTIFHGHKSSDVDPFEGSVPLDTDEVACGYGKVVFPLRHWTDSDVWDYIEAHNIPVQETRYAGRSERDDKWHNNDYVHACTACIDPRNEAEVMCPKLGILVPNVSGEVPRFVAMPEYLADAKLKQKLREG